MSAVIIYKDKPYRFDGKRFEAIEWSQAKKHFVAALIPANKLLALSFKLPLSTSPEQLAVQVELKMYNEGGLDPNRDYAIDFVSYPLENENSYLIEAFAIAKDDLDASVGEYAKKIGFLDLVFPRFIAYEALYPQGAAPAIIDLFIHIGEEEAFAALYQNGRYIGYRAIDSLSQIAKRTGIETARLKSYLFQKGLLEESYSLEEKAAFEKLQEIIYKNVEKIVYSVNFKRSYFGVASIDRIIFDCEGGTITGLREYFVSFGLEGDLRPEVLSCCDLAPKEASLGVVAHYARTYEELEQKLNFTLYERQKPLTRYESFWVAAAAVALVAAIGGCYLYLSNGMSALDAKSAELEQKLAHYKRIETKYVAAIKKTQKQKEALAKQLQAQQQRNETIEESVQAIPFIQEAKKARQKMMNDIVEGLYTYRLSTKAIDQNGSKQATILVVSKDMQRERIAKFMDYMLKKGYRNVSTKEIVRKDGLYESAIEVAP